MNSHKTLSQKRTQLTTQLEALYEPPEAESIAQLWLEHVLQLDRMGISMNRDRALTEEEIVQINTGLKRLLMLEPIQYVMGYAWFYGRKFKVNTSVLIPRPETEELVQMVLKDAQSYNATNEALHILDMGTGSGCIPISLYLELAAQGRKSSAYGWDVSDGALEMAMENARALNAVVNFEKLDMLKTPDQPSRKWDMIVSNPPYVLERDKAAMRENVLAFEPELALFVPNEEPLRFYEAIVVYAKDTLKKGGSLWVEIHEDFGMEIKALFVSFGMTEVRLIQDFRGKDRFVFGRWNLPQISRVHIHEGP